MQYPDSVEYLYALGNELKTAKLGLDRIRALLNRLGDPQRAFRVVHVAGTNGKGSTCAMIAAGLESAGLRTGLYTSPHLLEPTERIRIEGRDISRQHFVEAFAMVHEAAEAMVAAGHLDTHPSYFETVTAMAFVAFARAGVEIAVVEVGLGGRLDATNVVEPELTVVTPVDFDHEAWLGKSIEAIAFEKAGILKPGAPALFGPQKRPALAVLQSRAASLAVPLHLSSEWQLRDVELHADGSRFVAARRRPFRIECPLRGAFQVENARTAVAALDMLAIPAPAIEQGLRNVRWGGRLERVAENPDVYIDGAHNPAGCEALAEFLRSLKASRRVWLIFGAMRDKAVSEMAATLFPLADELIVTAPNQPRALRPELLAEESQEQYVHVAATLEDALRLLPKDGSDDAVVIAGSLFLAGEAKAAFRARLSLSAIAD